MSPNSRRSVTRGPFLNCCLLLTLLLAGVAGFTALTRKAGAVFVAPGFSTANKALTSAPDAELANRARLREGYGKLPLNFEANQGQTDRSVKFLSRGSGYGLFLTPTEAVLRLGIAEHGSRNELNEGLVDRSTKFRNLKSTVLRMKFVGANPAPQIAGVDQLPGASNYFVGNDPAKWRTNVPNYAKVKYEGMYPGVDLVMYGNQRELEYDFVVAPGADPNNIRLAFEGARQIRVDAAGDLVLRTRGGDVRERKPVIYQEVNGSRRTIDGRYIMKGRKQVGFEVAKYDASLPLVIDPILVYSTLIGGSGREAGYGIAVDADGNAYITGVAPSPDFPTTPGAFQTTPAGGDGYVAKLDPTGSSLVFSTYIGGAAAYAITLDSARNIYVTGRALANFPATPGAYRTFMNGYADAFILKLNSGGDSLAYATFLGGSNGEDGGGIGVDALGNAAISGTTNSTNFPVTPGAFQPTYGGNRPFTSLFSGDVFVTKINATGSALIFSTYLGGTGDEASSALAGGTAVDLAGNVYVSGATNSTDFPLTPGAYQTTYGGDSSPLARGDAFVAKFDPIGGLVYSTYLGGAGYEAANHLTLDALGNAYVVGMTESVNFPVTPGVYQPVANGGQECFVTKLNPLGTALVFSTYFGGPAPDSCNGVALDAAGNVLIGGYTLGSFFPPSPGCDPLPYRGQYDGFVAKLNAAATARPFFSYLGSTGQDEVRGVGVDAAGYLYACGTTTGPPTDFPATPGAYQGVNRGDADAFVAKFDTNVCNDACPDDPNKTDPGVCGCGVADTDTDNDGTPDCHDSCPNDPNKIAPGVCGCGVADTDTDHDGTPDCNDACPSDPNKIAPGACGCGVADTDSDHDGTADCHDACPSDPNKIAPGACGCGVADTDSDHDGTADCHDACPSDPNKIAPGVCGCGVADTDSDHDGIPNCHDNCPTVFNPDQRDTNGDGVGDACTPFQFPSGGEFVIGDDVSLTNGATVYFWGSQWSQNNPMSGGSAPNAFKGFENGNASPSCGSTWTTGPGNSSDPPPTVPQYMAVIVSSSIQKNGSVISGDIKKIVVVRTKSGYGPSPGHAGTGQIVAILCGPSQSASLGYPLMNSPSLGSLTGLGWLSAVGVEVWDSGALRKGAFTLSL